LHLFAGDIHGGSRRQIDLFKGGIFPCDLLRGQHDRPCPLKQFDAAVRPALIAQAGARQQSCQARLGTEVALQPLAALARRQCRTPGHADSRLHAETRKHLIQGAGIDIEVLTLISSENGCAVKRLQAQ